MHTSEAKMQAEIFQFFWNNYPQTRRLIFHVPNGGSRTAIEAVQLRSQGVVPGVCDLLLLWKGVMHGIELKIPGGRLSDAQIKLHQLWRDNGFSVHVCWDKDETIELIKKIIGS